MSRIPHYFCCYYLTRTGYTRSIEYLVQKLVKGLKGDPYNGYILYRDKRYFADDFDTLAKALLPNVGRATRKSVGAPFNLVPIPNSGMAIGAKGEFRSPYLARLVMQGAGEGVEVCEALRWDKPRDPSHKKSGVRDPDDYEPHLRQCSEPRLPVVLFDDVFTSGAQITAACRFLADAGFPPVAAVTIAKSASEPQEGAISWRRDTIDYSRPVSGFDEDWEDLV